MGIDVDVGQLLNKRNVRHRVKGLLDVKKNDIDFKAIIQGFKPIMKNIYQCTSGGSLVLEAPLVVRYWKMITDMVKNNVADMTFQDLTNSGKNGNWTISTY